MARPDIKFTAGAAPYVDDAIERASDSIDGGKKIGGQLNRRFYPEVATRTCDWPDSRSPTPYRLWLPHSWELVSASAMSSGGVTLGVSDYILRPDSGPPYDRIEVLLSSSAVFDVAATHQRAVSITGVWGYSVDTAPAGTTVEALDASETGIDVSNSAVVGVGDVIIIDSERMLVTDVGSALDTAQNLGGSGLTAQANAVSVTVADGTAFAIGEILTIDSERIRVDDIAGNVLTVKRAVDGSVLAAHTAGADIYARRTLIVQRGALGTTAETHSSGATILRHVVPAAVRSLAVAEAVNTMLSEPHGYARMIGEGESAREASGRGLAQLRADALVSHGRKRPYRGAI